MILEARGLAIGYGRDHVVGRDLDAAIGAGEVLALLGPNGGGKTTLLKTMLGLIPPLAGEVRLDGRRLAAFSPPERARAIAYVPQVHAGTFAFPVEEIVLMGRSAHAGLLSRPSIRDRNIARAALERLGIIHLADRPYTLISGGERQLALIARALAQEPRLVILDEPTASLDFGNQGKVMRVIRSLADVDRLGVLFTTHDPNHALHFADRAMLVGAGRSASIGPVATMLTGARLSDLYNAEIVEVGAEERRMFVSV